MDQNEDRGFRLGITSLVATGAAHLELLVRRWSFDQIEFARKSQDGRMTLVLDENGTVVRSLWALMDSPDLERAKAALRLREGTTKPEYIGSYSRVDQKQPQNICVLDIETWLEKQGLDAVIWTALPFKFGNSGVFPSKDEVLAYLGECTGGTRENRQRIHSKKPLSKLTHNIAAQLKQD
ncbi:MAG: hypothetical protein HC777_03625 [Hyphomonadaceae bacterium]|nr:hypothetical protein [Hyphomonadaceae bacterium]